MLAVYEAKLGREEAERHAAEAVALSPGSAEVTYRQAVVHALGGRREQGTASLEQALRLGYSRSLASADDDLQTLRGVPRIKQLLAP
jgi:hypothetical protein